MRQLVITVHGIRTFGGWQEKLEDLLVSRARDDGRKIEVYNYKYGYFSIIAFLLPPLRWLVTRQFRTLLLNKASEDWDRIDLVAHSFGTHLCGWALMGIPKAERPKIHTLILAGSVLKTGFPWVELVGSSVQRVANECGIRDSVLILNQVVVLFTGMAGRVGFSGMTGRTFRNRYFDFGHSGYFETPAEGSPPFMEEHWLDLLIGDGDIPRIDDPRPIGPLHGLKTFLINNLEPIKLACYLAPLVAVTLWIYGLYVEAEEQRRIAEQRSMVATSRMLMDSQPTDAHLLALEVQDSKTVPGALPLLFEALSASLDEPTFFDTGGDKVSRLAISPDGKRVFLDSRVADSEASLFEIFDIATGRRLMRLEWPGATVHTVAFLTSDKLALADYDGQVFLLEKGEPSYLTDEPGTVSALSQGGELAAQATSTRITVWDTRNRKVVFSERAPDSLIRLRIGDDLPSLTVGTGSTVGTETWSPQTIRTVLRWDDKTKTWSEIDEDFNQTPIESSTGEYALEGTSIVALGSGEKLSELELEPWQSKGWSVQHFDFSFSPDGRLLMGWQNDLWILWRASTGEILKALRPSDNGRFRSLLDAQFSPVDPVAVAAETDGALQVLQTTPPYERSILQFHTYPFDLAFSPDGTLVTGTRNGEAARWSLSTGRRPFATKPKDHPEFKEDKGLLLDAAISSDGRRVAAMYLNGIAKLWSEPDGQELMSMGTGGTDGFDQGVEFVGSRLIIYGKDGIWSAREDESVRQLVAEPTGLYSLRTTADGELLIGGTSYGNVELRDAESGRVTERIAEGEGPGFESPRRGMDADYCVRRHLAAIGVSYGFAGVVELWKPGEGEPSGGLPHPEQLWSAAFSSDCESVLTAAQDGVVRIWDPDSEEVRASLDLSKEIAVLGKKPLIKAYWGHAEESVVILNAGGPIWVYDTSLKRQLAVISDRAYFSVSPMTHQAGVVAGSAEGDLYLWPLDPDELKGLVRARSGRCLTASQRVDYLAESRNEARAGERSCRRCISEFYEELAATSTEPTLQRNHAKAWRRYAECLEGG